VKYIAKTLYGLENVLAGELKSMGASDVKPLNRAVSFNGNKEMLYRANYCARTAISVLKPVAGFRIRSGDELYKYALKTEWGQYMDTDQTFSVVPVVKSPMFQHTGFPGLVLKDAVADWFRDKKGRRPSVSTGNPDVIINLHISNNQVDISLDSSAEPLFKRGYRKEQGLAPVNEVLAAGIILLSGWDAGTSLTDPMCGSGTIPIEAALMAARIPPGKYRSHFGFMKWKDYDSNLFEKLRNDCDSERIKPAVKISGSDISDKAVLQSENNIMSADLSDIISVKQCDFRDLKPLDTNGYIIMNPPYGQRIEADDQNEIYSMIGTVLKHNFPGYTACIITLGKENLKQIGLKPARKTTLFNGSLECTLVKYELYQGSRKGGPSS
jgi:putative N6-adenine-specific DNA methylase